MEIFFRVKMVHSRNSSILKIIPDKLPVLTGEIFVIILGTNFGGTFEKEGCLIVTNPPTPLVLANCYLDTIQK